MGRTKGRGQKADLAFACKGLTDKTQKRHCEADGHVLIEHLGLGCSRTKSINLILFHWGEHIETSKLTGALRYR